MVCNQARFLKHMEKIILVHEGRVSVYDTLSELLRNPNTPETLFEASDSTTERKRHER